MDQNQTVDNDLQKAIDDITNTTSTDPVFSDPVAAPSSIPEDDTGELSEPVGPFPEEAKVEMVAPAPEPIAPLESVNIPDLSVPPLETVPAPAPAPTPEPVKTDAPSPEMPLPSLSPVDDKLNTQQIKNAALRDLVPLLDRVDMDASQKFNIYCDIFEDLKDYTVLEPAYKIAREITDETERAKALLFLVETIDKM